MLALKSQKSPLDLQFTRKIQLQMKSYRFLHPKIPAQFSYQVDHPKKIVSTAKLLSGDLLNGTLARLRDSFI